MLYIVHFHIYRIYPIYSDGLKLFFLLSEHLIWKKIIIFLVSEYLWTPKNYQSSRVFTGIYAVTLTYIPIGVKINNLFNYMLFYQLEYM